MPNPKSTSVRNLVDSFAQSGAEMERCNRIELFFPDLQVRLNGAVEAIKVQPDIVIMACRHVLCAEALADILESKVSLGCGRAQEAAVVANYSDRVAAKLF